MIRFLLAVFLFLVFPLPAQAEEITSGPFDHSLWDQFLKKFGNEKGEVNYGAAQKDPQLLDSYLKKLKSFSTFALAGWSREERIAIWINAFNAGVIKSVLENYPIKSIMDIPGGWDQAVVQVGRAPRKKRRIEDPASLQKQAERHDASFTHSLNEIQNVFLRRTFRDEKILFALSQGAKGSARLRQEAYTGPRLEGQLFLAVREFVNDPSKNQIEPGKKKIVLSRLLHWYAPDFLINWGNFPGEFKWKPEEMAVLSFFAHYLEDSKKVEFLRDADYKVKYDVFDWRLNDWKPRKPSLD